MKIKQQFIVRVDGKWQILFVTNNGYFITTNGGFGQRDMYIEQITKEEKDIILKD